MSLGPVFVGFDGAILSDDARAMLSHPSVGGAVLFTRNFVDKQQLRQLILEIHSLRSPRLLVTVDQEGGRVQRFRDGFTVLPSLGKVGSVFHNSPDEGRNIAYRHGWLMATEMLDLGIDLSFAPVLDLDRGSKVIGDRSFSADVEVVVQLGDHYLRGMHDAGMAATGKHFPGHGSVHADSHVSDVCDERPLTDIESSDLVPFGKLCAQLECMMIAHVVYSQIDDCPAGYSIAWLANCLRSRLGYKGLVLSDDIGMHAARSVGTIGQRALSALSAGCDVVLACQPRDAADLLNAKQMPIAASLSSRLQAIYGKPKAPMGSLDDASHPDHDRICEWRATLEELAQP